MTLNNPAAHIYRVLQRPGAYVVMAYIFSKQKSIVGLDNLYLGLPNPRPSKSTFHKLIKYLVDEKFLTLTPDNLKKNRKIIRVHPNLLKQEEFFRLPEIKSDS